jgi:acyl phosphate:glycerol-3-phosphate acyltransferase
MHEIQGWINAGFVCVAYLLGSIPTAVWLGKAFYKTDVREHGSKNAGATNTFRVLGAKAGIVVLLLDALKGFLPVFFLPAIAPYVVGSTPYANLQVAMGLAAVIGHIFPVWADFRGGKGVATLLGVVFALHWMAALASLGVFLVVFAITRYVSLGSLISAICYPLAVGVVFKVSSPTMLVFSIVFAIIIIVTHQKNIERLLRKQENRLELRRKRIDRD